jgi:hypothetical protein
VRTQQLLEREPGQLLDPRGGIGRVAALGVDRAHERVDVDLIPGVVAKDDFDDEIPVRWRTSCVGQRLRKPARAQFLISS